MFELKIQVTDRLKAVSFLKTLSFVSSEYVLLETDGTLTVRLKDVPLSSYNTADLLDCGTIDRFLFDGRQIQREDATKITKTESKPHTTEEKLEENTESLGIPKDVWPAIDLLIKNSTDISSLATQLYKYLGLYHKNAAKFEALIANHLQHADTKISWSNLQKLTPQFSDSCIVSLRKKASEKGYKALELIQYILTNDAVKNMIVSREEEPDEHHEEESEQEVPQEHTPKVVLECMPKLCDTGNEQAVREFEDFLINCDKTQPLSTLIENMLKVATPDTSYDDVIINYAVYALTSIDTEAYVKDDYSFEKKRARATWSTIATKIAEKYDNSNHVVVTAVNFLEAIKPYLRNRSK